jgi:uncharacterized protein YndB with AHSA1/START domain
VDAPRERVYEYLLDVANHAEFTDHFLKDFHLGRLDSAGVGASASFRIDYPLGRQWGELVVAEADRAHRIRLEGCMGRIGRVKTEATYTLTPAGHGMTTVELSFETQPPTRADRLRESLGLRGWLVRQSRRALQRLAETLEEGEPSAHAAGVAAG